MGRIIEIIIKLIFIILFILSNQDTSELVLLMLIVSGVFLNGIQLQIREYLQYFMKFPFLANFPVPDVVDCCEKLCRQHHRRYAMPGKGFYKFLSRIQSYLTNIPSSVFLSNPNVLIVSSNCPICCSLESAAALDAFLNCLLMMPAFTGCWFCCTMRCTSWACSESVLGQSGSSVAELVISAVVTCSPVCCVPCGFWYPSLR